MNAQIKVYALQPGGPPTVRYQGGITYDGREYIGPACSTAKDAVVEAMTMLLTAMGDCGARPLDIQVTETGITPGAYMRDLA